MENDGKWWSLTSEMVLLRYVNTVLNQCHVLVVLLGKFCQRELVGKARIRVPLLVWRN